MTLPTYESQAPTESLTQGKSPEALFIGNKATEGRERFQKSYALGDGRAAFNALMGIALEGREGNWDGHGAMPLQKETVQGACRFLDALPFGFPPPTIGAEPDGHITLEWYKSPTRTLSISISPQGDLHYAALLGPNKAYGTEAFLGEIPRRILGLIQGLYQ